MNPNDQYRLWTFVFLIRLTEQSVNHHLREFNIPQKNTNELGPAWHIAGNHCIREQKKIAFSYSDLIKLNDLKPLFSRKKSLTFQKRSGQRKCSCIGGQILLNRINNNHWQLIYVSRTIPSSQYETILWSTHVNIVRLTEPIRRRFSKSRGLPESVSFLPSPPPPPIFIFWFLFHFSRGQNRESRSSVFLCSETKRKTLPRRLPQTRWAHFLTLAARSNVSGSFSSILL